ncbi:anti-sigma factor [Mesorhizobium sp. RMAD-H1]|uniref:anti-sigma factor family protein n=1 Tax=Mesorhizobium sp. RMAD-H1 TaxID=2587065 RepID=UPI0016075CFC|nr:anti-sigma factor [Mesorhizobium sp. RMAD-H1]MBB2973314.1 anti-sigma factor RsiW [Mesorhizobium sp. RMAD-H1]
MSEPHDPILDADLDAYVDDQLDVARRIEVEAYLSGHPDVAARVMADLRTRDELRLALAGSRGGARPATTDAARRLERGLIYGRLLGSVQRVAAVTLLVAAGWLANEAFGPLKVRESVASTPPPAYVEDAVQAHRTSMLRAEMVSQPQILKLDTAEIRAATAIAIPELPRNWHVKDVQIYPSQFGPSVEIAIDSEDLGGLSLFAVRPGHFDVVPPKLVTVDDASAAYFQIGDVAYALVARPDAEHLDRAAERLARSLH